MSRQSKTPRQRAQEALDVADRIVDRLTKKRDALQADLVEVRGELAAAEARRDYLKQHPDLAPTTSTSTGADA